MKKCGTVILKKIFNYRLRNTFWNLLLLPFPYTLTLSTYIKKLLIIAVEFKAQNYRALVEQNKSYSRWIDNKEQNLLVQQSDNMNWRVPLQNIKINYLYI